MASVTSRQNRPNPILCIAAVAGFFPLFDAGADDQTCVFKADKEDVHVCVEEEDDEREDNMFFGIGLGHLS